MKSQIQDSEMEDISNTERDEVVTDPEERITPDMIEEAKLHACLDRFLIQLSAIDKVEFSRDNLHLLDFKSFTDEENEMLKGFTVELSKNLKEMLSRAYQGKDILEDGDIQKGLHDRLVILFDGSQSHGRYEGSDNFGPWAGSFFSQLVDPLFTHFCEKMVYGKRDGSKKTPMIATRSPKLAFEVICKELEESIGDRKKSSAFVCGGLVAIENRETTSISSGGVSVSPPVRIFWGASNEHDARKLALPLSYNSDPASASKALQQLVKDCDTASFGIGQENVIDPEYRKAGKLDPQRFATSFQLSDFGILENVEQILLPRSLAEEENRLPFRKLKAELYKLNVYSGPTGLFQKHVDTPRSESQIGSLVVCLPSRFQGGCLFVQHQGKRVEFDWSQHSETTIQWAAFYSDCEHSILTVTEGDRITLTYNLYVIDPMGGSIPPKLIVDPRTLSLYERLQGILGDSEFMRMGGTLGIYCSHSYPHTSDEVKNLLPKALKGADLELYSIFKDLGVHVEVLPVLESQSEHPIKDYIKEDEPLEMAYAKFLSSSPIGSSNLDLYWKFLLFSRRMNNLADLSKFAQESKLNVGYDDSSQGRLVGEELAPYISTDGSEQYSELDEVIAQSRRWDYLPGVIWIGNPGYAEMDFSYMAYGNESTISAMYSHAALIVEIPPFHKREELAAARD